MKKFLLINLLLSTLLLTSFSNNEIKKKISFSLTLENCENIDSLYLFEFDGILFKKITSTPKQADGSFQFQMPKTKPRFYYVGTAASNAKPFILGPEEGMHMIGTCQQMRAITIKNSPLNTKYNEVKQQVKNYQGQMGGVIRQYQKAVNNPTVKAELDGKLATIDQERVTYLNNLRKTDPYLAKVAELNTYLSFQNNGKDFDNEIAYFSSQYFEFADWSDEDYNYLPWVYEGLKSYTTTLSSIGLNPDQHKAYLTKVLSQIPKDSRTYKLAFGGALAAMQSKNHPNYVHFGKQFVQEIGEKDVASSRHVAQNVQRLAAFAIGGEAPDFAMNTPDGETKNLKDLRGNVLLVDFWASWCGPCRRENPHVKKMYDKYQNKGFEILGVSLDRDKSRWLAAIEKDNLPWHHVSDLKGWQNEAAKLYGVKSIPHTVLLDKEGKIVAKNLRGPSLEAKLAEIFGE